MKTIIAVLLLSVSLAAEDKPAATDPVSDKLRFEIAVMQRNYLVAKAQMDSMSQQIEEKQKQAQQVCASAGKDWKPETFTCTEKAK